MNDTYFEKMGGQPWWPEGFFPVPDEVGEDIPEMPELSS